jgi:hypothetical protein
MYILHNWKIVYRTNSKGEYSICVGGRVYGNSRFTSGEPITTSSISWYRIESGSAIVSTRNGSEYMLGKPSSSEPFARQRLIRYLEERGRLGAGLDGDIHTRRLPHYAIEPEDSVAPADEAEAEASPTDPVVLATAG